MALKKETLAKEFAAHLAKAMRDNNCLANDTGTWQVTGEVKDPSFFSRNPHGPHLGFVTGQLADAVAWAVLQPNFFEWGAGGEIRKVTPIDVTGQAACID